MPVSLVNDDEIQETQVRNLKDGDIAVIVKWGPHYEYVGRVIQKFGVRIVSIGLPSGQAWDTTPVGNQYTARVLQPGEKLVIS